MARINPILISALLLLGGCLDLPVTFSPSQGSIDVPVNVAIRYRYIGPEFIRESQINEKNFRLSVCANPQAQQTANTGATNGSSTQGTQNSQSPGENQTQNQTSGTAAGAATPVEGWVTFRKYNVTRKYSNDGREEQLKKTEVIFIPKPKSADDPPLQLSTDYCFEASNVKDEKGNDVLGATTSFRTEENTKFFFSVTAAAQFYPRKTKDGDKVSPYSTLAFQFDNAVDPTDLDAGTRLCIQDTTTTTTSTSSQNPCRGGSEISGRTLVMIEAYPESDKILTTGFKTFGLMGPVTFTDPGSYTIRLGLKKAGGNMTGGRMDFQVGDGVEDADQQLLKTAKENKTLATLLLEKLKIPSTFLPFIQINGASEK